MCTIVIPGKRALDVSSLADDSSMSKKAYTRTIEDEAPPDRDMDLGGKDEEPGEEGEGTCEDEG